MALWMPQWLYPTRTENQSYRKGPDFYAKQRKIDVGLATMEKDLNDEEFCHGDTFTLADITPAAAHLICVDIRLPKMDWRKHFPALARHLARIAKRGSFNIL